MQYKIISTAVQFRKEITQCLTYQNRVKLSKMMNKEYLFNNFFVCIQCPFRNILCNVSNPTMRTGLDFKSAQFDPVRGEAEDWIKLRGLEI